jgi:hypothetical protein
MIRFVLIPRFCELSGYTEKAVRRKMESGVWLEGGVWRKAPDGHILIDLEGYDAWAEGQTQQDLKSVKTASDSASTGGTGAVVKPFASHQPQPT